MKTQITKKVFAFIIVTMMFSASAKSQIVYTDVNPDATLSGNDSLLLDINSDGQNDFRIRRKEIYNACTCGAGSTYGYYISSLNSSAWFSASNTSCVSGTILSANKFGLNDIINDSLNWRSSSSGIALTQGNKCCFPGCNGSTHIDRYVFCGYCGYWSAAGGADNYIAIKILTGGNYYFGWICLNNINVIKSYGRNSIPNQPILAGETSCSSPTVTLSASGPLSFCAGDSVILTANGTGYQYQWKKGGVNIAGAKSQTYVAKTGGVYKCKVTNSCGSKTSGGKTVTVPCRMSNENFVETLEHLSVFPNPATNSVTIKFPSDEEGTIQIANLFGQIVFSEKVNAEQEQIDVSRFPAGMYVVKWSSGGNNETKKFSVINK